MSLNVIVATIILSIILLLVYALAIKVAGVFADDSPSISRCFLVAFLITVIQFGLGYIMLYFFLMDPALASMVMFIVMLIVTILFYRWLGFSGITLILAPLLVGFLTKTLYLFLQPVIEGIVQMIIKNQGLPDEA